MALDNKQIASIVFIIVGLILLIVAYAAYSVPKEPVVTATTEPDKTTQQKAVDDFNAKDAVAKRASDASTKEGLLISGFVFIAAAIGMLVGDFGCADKESKEGAAYYDF